MTPAPSNNINQGIAGRTDYGTWDKIAKNLVEQSEAEEQTEIQQQKELLGHDKYAVSKDHADEQKKAEKIMETKNKLESFKQREEALVANITNVFAETCQVKRLTRDDLEAGQRVIRLTDCHGTSVETSKLVLTQDLSNLVSKVSNPSAKSYPSDAENAAPAYEPTSNVSGLIKVFVENVSNCTIIIKAKVITNCIEIHNCSNLQLIVDGTATVATVQADLCQDVGLLFREAPSGKSTPHQFLGWGDDADDRVFHAGCTNLSVTIERDGLQFASIVCDYNTDGAKAIGNATVEEFQFVTSLHKEQLVTEAVVRNATNNNVRAMTQRELEASEQKKQQIAKHAMALADKLMTVKDKDGNVLVNKKELPNEIDAPEMTEMAAAPEQSIVDEIHQLKARGNEAFGAGEYGQAVLQYSLGIDKAAELTDATRYPLEILYTNRAASFLKLGDHAKAIEDSDHALTINPQHLKALFRKGLALHAAKRYEEAMPVLAQAYKLEPHNKQIQQALQFCEVRLQAELRNRMNQ